MHALLIVLQDFIAPLLRFTGISNPNFSEQVLKQTLEACITRQACRDSLPHTYDPRRKDATAIPLVVRVQRSSNGNDSKVTNFDVASEES